MNPANRAMLSTTVLAIAVASASAFSVAPALHHPTAGAARAGRLTAKQSSRFKEPVRTKDESISVAGFVDFIQPDDAWNKYVLLRPSTCELDEDGTVERHPVSGATCETQRTPGTFRTVIFSSIVCFIMGFPLLLANPVVLPRLIEAATVSNVQAVQAMSQTSMYLQ